MSKKNYGQARLVSGIAILIAFLFVGTTQASIITMADGDYDNDDWTLDTLSEGAGTASLTIQPSGGNPGAHLLHHHNVPTDYTLVFTRALYTAEDFDPSTQGSVQSLTMTIDLLEDPYVAGWSAAVMVIEQAGEHYYSSSGIHFSSGYWNTYMLSCDDPADFDQAPSDGSFQGGQPDFSVGGAPLRFGYLLMNYAVGSGWIQLNHKSDNWSMEIVSVPEPATLALLAFGLPLIRRRR